MHMTTLQNEEKKEIANETGGVGRTNNRKAIFLGTEISFIANQ